MFEIQKQQIIRDRIRKNNWPKTHRVLNKSRYESIKTAFQIFIALSTNYYLNLSSLCRITGKSPKTIRRMLAVLDEIGIPIIVESYDYHKLAYRISKTTIKNLKLN